MKLLIVWRLEESSGISYHLSVQRVKMQTEREFKICLWKLQEWDRGGDEMIETYIFFFKSTNYSFDEYSGNWAPIFFFLTFAWEDEFYLREVREQSNHVNRRDIYKNI